MGKLISMNPYAAFVLNLNVSIINITVIIIIRKQSDPTSKKNMYV